MLTRDFADKLLAAAGQPSLAELEKTDRRGFEAAFAELKGWTLSGADRDRTDIDQDQERRRRSGRGRPACERDGRHRRALRPPGPRRHDLGVAGHLLQRHPQRGRRQCLGDVDGAGAGPAAGCPPRSRCLAGSSSWRSPAKSAGCSARNTTSSTRSSRSSRRS